MLHELISHMNFFHLQWEPHNLRHVIFSKTRWEQAFFSVCTSGTRSLIPQGSFWKRQTGVLLMVQGTVSENTSWIMERTVHVLQKATVREGCLISVSVPLKKKKIARSSVQFKIQGWSVSRLEIAVEIFSRLQLGQTPTSSANTSQQKRTILITQLSVLGCSGLTADLKSSWLIS